ncbi:MAG TPA: HU family DNA-binding protein [Opitutales bacterium]|nr:HU family DNA-binding protein [Opitutales bacterium]
MNKSQLVAEVQKNLGPDTSKAAAERAVEAVLEGIKTGIQSDEVVQLIGFGTFNVTERAAREGVNPRTKERIQIKASKSVRFKPGAGLKAAVAQ